MRVRRVVFVFVVGGLIAAIPLSAVASESIINADVQRAESQFNQSLATDIRGGLDSDVADTMVWRYLQIDATKTPPWWQAPIVEHNKFASLNQLNTELDALYQLQVSESRDALQRQLHRWNWKVAQAQSAGISSAGLDVNATLFTNYAAQSTTPNALVALASVLGAEYAELDGRMAAYNDARAQVDAAAQTAQSLLASAGQYAQLNLAGFQSQLASATSGWDAVHSADAFTPILAQLQQTAASLQGLLNARSDAINQLAAARSALASANSVGALVGNGPGVINSLASQVTTAADQGTFESISSQLFQETELLNSDIWIKEQAPIVYTPGAGKLIVISISRQELTAFQDGTAVLTSLVTTGRPALPTPPGVYRVFARYSPYEMISPWGYGSAFWYPPSWTNWAMEFRTGGYFIHDAPWRSWYGPGSDIYNGTHGCVNVPRSNMAFLWNWTPIGTTVVVQY
jgi:lipoprotein-anchoring transpeptidase ErfK/SrfK